MAVMRTLVALSLVLLLVTEHSVRAEVEVEAGARAWGCGAQATGVVWWMPCTQPQPSYGALLTPRALPPHTTPLTNNTDETTTAVQAAARKLLQGVRSFSNVTQHKTPRAPQNKRRNYERRFPAVPAPAPATAASGGARRALLQGRAGTRSGNVNPGSPRAFTTVAAH
jgi:hypothetical protein